MALVVRTWRVQYVVVKKFCMYCPAVLPIEDEVLICLACYEREIALAMQKRQAKKAARNQKVPAVQRAAVT